MYYMYYTSCIRVHWLIKLHSVQYLYILVQMYLHINQVRKKEYDITMSYKNQFGMAFNS